MLTKSEQILDRLIAFPTVSRDSNLALIKFVGDYLSEHGIESVLVHDDTGDKANLYARIGPDVGGGVMLSGHTDVVPVDGQDWTREAFRMTPDGERLYGRGTADMKGFLACVLALVPRAARCSLTVPLHLAFSYDEEIGCIGVRRLLDMLEPLPERPAFCIVGEPTEMQVGIAHKGKLAAACTCRGVEAHSALADRGLNAIYLASEMIQALRGIQEDIRTRGPHDHHFSVPWTTIQVGTIQGGTALNIIPGECRFALEIRNTPHVDPDALLSRIEEAAGDIVSRYRGDFPDAAIDIAVTNRYPALDTRPEEEVVRRVQDLMDTEDFIKLAFGTEGGLFQQRLGLSTVICGPGSMEQGHKPDEFIARSELARCDAFLGRLLDQISTA